MKKIIWKGFIIRLIILFFIGISSCAGYFSYKFYKSEKKKNQNEQKNFGSTTPLKKPSQESINNSSQKENKTEVIPIKKWIPYVNQKIGYQIEYPYNWYFLKDACCPPPPAFVVFNNYSDTKAEFSAKQLEPDVHGISILCNYEGTIDNIGEIKSYKEEGLSGETRKVNGFDTVIFTRNRNPEDPAIQFKTYYIVDGTQGCRITYDSDCSQCQQIAESFKFLE